MTVPHDFRIIDSHAHMGPMHNFYLPYNDASGMLKTMDLLGIEATVISSNAAISADIVMGNRYTLDVINKYPERFLGQFVVNPHYSDLLIDDIENYFKVKNIIGFKIHPELHGDYPMNGKGYVYMWTYADEHHLPVLTHTYFGGDRLEVIMDIAMKYPNVSLIIGHGGMDLGIGKTIDMVNSQPNLYFDLCSPVNKNHGAIKLVAKECNPDKVLFGTDSPWNDPCLSVGAILFAEVDDDIRKKWFRSNFFNVYARAGKVLKE